MAMPLVLRMGNKRVLEYSAQLSVAGWPTCQLSTVGLRCQNALLIQPPNCPLWATETDYYVNVMHLLNALAALDRLNIVCVSVNQWVCHTKRVERSTEWSLSPTDLHQTCHQGKVPGDVVTYCFWWKSKIFLSAKPEVELILTIASSYGKISLMLNISKTVRDTMLDSKEVR